MDLSEFQGQDIIFVDVNCKTNFYVLFYLIFQRPNFMKWAEAKMGIDKSMTTPA